MHSKPPFSAASLVSWGCWVVGVGSGVGFADLWVCKAIIEEMGPCEPHAQRAGVKARGVKNASKTRSGRPSARSHYRRFKVSCLEGVRLWSAVLLEGGKGCEIVP